MNWLPTRKTDQSFADIKVGEKAQDFILPENLGQRWRLSENIGRVIALLFYPQNETLVCTRQLCSIRDHWAEYLVTSALVIGISPGSVKKHREFASKYRLPMPLLVDEGRKITNLYGRHSWMPISWSRAVIIIDAKGIIRHKMTMFRGFRPTNYTILSAIYEAKIDASQDRFQNILDKHRKKNKND